MGMYVELELFFLLLKREIVQTVCRKYKFQILLICEKRADTGVWGINDLSFTAHFRQ